MVNRFETCSVVINDPHNQRGTLVKHVVRFLDPMTRRWWYIRAVRRTDDIRDRYVLTSDWTYAKQMSYRTACRHLACIPSDIIDDLLKTRGFIK